MTSHTESERKETMKTFAAFIVALSFFAASAVHATTDVAHAPTDAGSATLASPAVLNSAELSDALLLPGNPFEVREPEQTAIFFWILIWICVETPHQC